MRAPIRQTDPINLCEILPKDPVSSLGAADQWNLEYVNDLQRTGVILQTGPKDLTVWRAWFCKKAQKSQKAVAD